MSLPRIIDIGHLRFVRESNKSWRCVPYTLHRKRLDGDEYWCATKSQAFRQVEPLWRATPEDALSELLFRQRLTLELFDELKKAGFMRRATKEELEQ